MSYSLSSGDREVWAGWEGYRASRVAAHMVGNWKAWGARLRKAEFQRLEVFGCSSEDESSEDESSDGKSVGGNLLCTAMTEGGHETTFLMMIVGNNLVHLVDRNGDVMDTFIFDGHQHLLKSCKDHVLFRSESGGTAPCRITYEPQKFESFREKVIALSDKQLRCLDEARDKNRARSCGMLAGIWGESHAMSIRRFLSRITALEIQKVSKRLVCTISKESGIEENFIVSPSEGCGCENVFVMLDKDSAVILELLLLRLDDQVFIINEKSGVCYEFQRMPESLTVIRNASGNVRLQKRVRGLEDASLDSSKRSRSNH
mmetsp:Transcript_70276/g.125105  ORF Transcript_70276/g.125105 Transcript_70276/m.125105 type:complete len:316 (+) Transcript_70276:80-1027(+)